MVNVNWFPYKNHSVVKKDFDDWIIVEDAHVPLVSKEMRLEAQQIGRKNNTQTVRRAVRGVTTISCTKLYWLASKNMLS